MSTGNSRSRDLRVVVIGAGMSGILAGIRLRQSGINDFVIYEKADRLGGTWRENTYPGLSCDVPSHHYVYSFEPNPEWSHLFSSGAEIENYFKYSADKYGVSPHIRYGKQVTRAVYGGRWHLTCADGSSDSADVIIRPIARRTRRSFAPTRNACARSMWAWKSSSTPRLRARGDRRSGADGAH